MSEHIGTAEAREEGFYWVSSARTRRRSRGEWWLAGEPRPWQAEAVTVLSDRLVFTPRLVPVA